MSTTQKPPTQAGNDVVNKAKRETTKPWVHTLERIGFITRGLIYIVIGLLSLKLAAGAGGTTASPSGAIKIIGNQPFGEVLLIIIAIGLAGYSLWGFIRAIFDPLRRGNDMNGLIDRAGFLFSGASYGALLIPTVQTLMNKPSSQGSAAGLWTKLTTGPSGKWIIMGFAFFWIASGIGQLVEGFTSRFLRDLKTSTMSKDEIKAATTLGQAGYIARGIVFAMIGVLVLRTFLASGSSQPKGFGDALAALQRAPYGTYLLGAVAIGLILFGIYSAMCAKWNRAVNHTKR